MKPFEFELPTTLTAADLISFSPMVFNFLISFINYLQTIDMADVIHNYQHGGDYMTIQETYFNLIRIADFTIHVAERGLSYYHTDPTISLYDYVVRYNNIVRYFHYVDEIFDRVQNFISELENNHQNDPRFREYLDGMNRQGNRLRIGTNVLVRVLRDCEGIIHTHYPDFEFLPKQWFE